MTSQISESIPEERLCKECKHLIGKRYSPENAKEWVCGHPQNIQSTQRDVVTGELIRTFNTPLCYQQRTPNHLHICGYSGTWWEQYIPIHIEYAQASEKETFSPKDLEQNKEAARQKLEAIRARRTLKATDLDNL